MLARAAATLPEFDRPSDHEFAVFLEPPSLDDRIVNQFALFSMMSNPEAQVDTWLAGRPELLRRVNPPAGLKRDVRHKLDQANETERVLFPGLDGLSLWLKRYYSRRRGGLRVVPATTPPDTHASPPVTGRHRHPESQPLATPGARTQLLYKLSHQNV